MNKENFLETIKSKLVLQKEEILKKTCVDYAVDVDGDETDEIQGSLLLKISEGLAVREMLKLKNIDLALKKIENKSYGICEDCGEDISSNRLLHNPYFLTCISCAEDREKEAKQKRSQ